MKRLLALLLAAGSAAHADVTATYGPEGGQNASTVVPVPALQVAKGDPASPYLAPGPFTVTWQGQLTVPQRQRLCFTFDGNGTATLKINGELVNKAHGLDVIAGPIGLQSEGGEIHFRNIRISSAP